MNEVLKELGMKAMTDRPGRSFFRELAGIRLRLGEMWRLIPRRLKFTLVAAVAIMALGGAANTLIPIYLGKVVDSVNSRPERPRDGESSPSGSDANLRGAAAYLAVIGGMYLRRRTRSP